MRAALTFAASLALAGFAMPTDPTPPNTVPLSQMMRELSAQPGFTEAFLKDIQSGPGKHGAALLTPDLIHHLREMILGKDWQGLDHFPGWTMAEVTPTVRVVAHYAGKDDAVKGTATAGGAPAGNKSEQQTSTYLDLGAYVHADHQVDLDQPSTLPGFSTASLVSSLGDGVTRGDGPSELAGEHAASQRLADVLNRLSLNEGAVAGIPFAAGIGSHSYTTPQQLIAGIIITGHAVTVTDSRYFANFGHLHYKGQDVMMPFYINTKILVPGTKRPLLIPVAHAEYEWHIRGPLVNADVSFYFGIDGKAEFRTMDQLDQAWVMKRDAHIYNGGDAVEVTRLSGAIVRAYMRLHAANPELPFGGYYGLGVCQDVVAAIELKMTGHATLFPNTADDSFFTNPADAEINDLIRRLPKDREGTPDAARVFASLPFGSSDADLATATIPGLAPDLIAVHDAWTNGTLKHVRPRWQKIAAIAFLCVAVLGGLAFARRRRS